MNWSLTGFLAAAVMAAGIADYVDQSRMAGLPVGEIGLFDYVGQFGIPNAAHNKAIDEAGDIDVADAKAYLPAAPSGWVRRSWTKGDNSWLHKQRRLGDEGALVDGTPLERFFDGFLDHRDIYAQRRAFANGWIYQRGDEMIFIGAEVLDHSNKNSVVGRSLSKVNGSLNTLNFRDGFAVIDGVPYAEIMRSVEDKRLYRSIQGRMGYGQEVRIRVRSHASEESVRALLSRVNHSALNEMLDHPLQNIGAGAPRMNRTTEQKLAGYAFAIREKMGTMSKPKVREVLSYGVPMDLAIAQLKGNAEALASAGN